MTPPPTAPLDKEESYCNVNSIPLIYEYEVENSEAKVDRDNQYVQEMEDDNETSEPLIIALNT